jgi:hypothetical protein
MSASPHNQVWIKRQQKKKLFKVLVLALALSFPFPLAGE